jgi:hypothetical protein
MAFLLTIWSEGLKMGIGWIAEMQADMGWPWSARRGLGEFSDETMSY